MEILTLAMAVLLIIIVVSIYNGIISRDNAVKRAWAGVITQERQKNKIIPHLEELTGKYGEFEKGVLTSVTELRSAIAGLDEDNLDQSGLQQVEAKTKEIVSGLKLTVEAYPELNASVIYNNLMKEIAEQQENIGAAIRIFNQNVEMFNNGIETFPNSIVNSFLNKKDVLKTFKDLEAEKGFEYTPNFS